MIVQCLIAAAVLTIHAAGWYIPGTGPRDYYKGENVPVQVNVLTSVNTHLPYDYYDLPFCYPSQRTKGESENLGQVLMGDRIKPSPFEQLRIGEDLSCVAPCGAHKLDDEQRKELADRVQDDYRVNLLMDNLPLTVMDKVETGRCYHGVPLGTIENGVAYVYNHLELIVKYHALTEEEETKKATTEARKRKAGNGATFPPEHDDLPIARRIIAFVARPHSIRHDPADASRVCSATTGPLWHLPPQKANDDQIVWSYSVRWEETHERWATRWDVYLKVQHHEIRWHSIANSVLIVLLLTAIVAIICVRMLRPDIIKPKTDEIGWKMIHKEVFRAPSNRWLLATFAGTGTQLYGCTWTVLISAALGFLSPANRGSLLMSMLLCFVFLGMFAGYTAARLLKLWGAPSWNNIFATATMVPGVAFSAFAVLNLAVWVKGSSAAVPFAAVLAVVAMWFCVSLPLVFLGALFGFRRETIKVPVAVAQIPRHIPSRPWHKKPYFTVPIAGILPFGAVFIELFFILTALWLNRYYYAFGFLLLVFIILSLTCAETTIVMTYYQLCAEDYNWWWRSFLTSGSGGGYLFLYAVYFCFIKTSPPLKGVVSLMLYFSYMGLLSFIFFVMTGTIGFMATFAFVRYIYGSAKLDLDNHAEM
jgi:transmembrane 9 superfamily protein 2/4